MTYPRLLRDRSGAAAVEFSMIAMLLIVLIFGIIDFSMAIWQWNSAEKATEFGVRLAVVSSPIANGLETFDCKTNAISWGARCSTAGAGQLPTVLCRGDTASCTGGFAYSAVAFAPIATRMQSVYLQLLPENITIQYADSGLGFAGRPGGPVPAVTVCLQNMNFDFTIINGLLGFGTIAMPPFCATLTAEDMNTAGT